MWRERKLCEILYEKAFVRQWHGPLPTKAGAATQTTIRENTSRETRLCSAKKAKQVQRHGAHSVLHER
jgi:hypothetical protein